MIDEIKKISINNSLYPERLKEIKNPPQVLYFKGRILPKENCFAIVGTRRCSSYGKQVALEIARDLTEAGLTITSGLATGIDTFSHWAPVEMGKRTIAVLGTGLDKKSIYPQSNLGLAKRILEAEGCLISEYKPQTPGAKFTFPNRNRIISGLSLGVLVVEAKRKSGSLITADWARRQGRKVFAIPGPIHSLNSWGSHFLIKKGAKLVESAQDILTGLNIKYSAKEPSLAVDTKEEFLIFQVLAEGPLEINKIIEKTKLSASLVASTLSVLEIKGKITNLGKNTYAISHR